MRIDLPAEMQKRTPACQLEPRAEWHGREVEVLGRGVFRFPDDARYTYHLINPEYLKVDGSE